MQNITIAGVFHASTPNTSESSVLEHQRVPSILNGKYFSVVEKKSNAKCVIGLCQFCLPKKTEIRGQVTSSSNFLSHLKRKHFNQFEEYCSESARKKQRASAGFATNEEAKKVTQNQFEMDVARYVINSMIPLKWVEDTYFRQIFNNLGLGAKINTISRRTLGRTINKIYTDSVCDIKNQLNAVPFVCTTADIWSGRRRTFFGVTAHWISPDYERKSAALACRRFAGVHSFNKITDLLHSIHSEFGLSSGKIVATITNNGSTFAKAFRMFGIKEALVTRGDEEDCMSSSSDNSSSDEEDIEESTPVNADYMNNLLPRQLRCSAHTLNLCITTDMVRTINSNEALSAVHTEVMQKCNILWKEALRPKFAETIEQTIGHTLKRPGKTRWNSLYDSLQQILRIKDKMSELAKLLEIKSVLRENDFIYLEEHIKCTAPIAEAIDILQGDNVFYGTLLPCLLTLRRKLTKLVECKWIFCEPISTCLLDTFQSRFQDYLNFTSPESDNAALAALTHPQFKNRWFMCIDQYQRDRLLDLLKHIIVEEMNASNECSIDEPSTTFTYNDFFDFGDVIKHEVTEYSSKASDQVSIYFFHLVNM